MLHGEVKINGAAIIQWQARRNVPLGGTDDFHTYDCVYDQCLPRRVVRFELRHRYSDGAGELATKVLIHGEDLVRTGERR